MTRALALCVILTGCSGTGGAAYSETTDLPQQHATVASRTDPQAGPPQFEKQTMVRFHMQRHFDDLRNVERALVAGRLDEVTALAHLLSMPTSDPGMAPWQTESARVAAAATALEHAKNLDEACRLEPRIAAACAGCHQRTGATPVFRPAPPAPADQPTPRARMARHQWAVDRLWEGIVGGADLRWRAGLEVLAATPLPVMAIEQPGLAGRLQDLASKALETRSPDQRAASYGELLVTCNACHARLHPGPR